MGFDMVSQMAKEDVAALIAEGITPSFEQCCDLNALGLLVERGPYAGIVYAAPRVAWAGPVAVFEPTIQSEQWYIEKASDWWTGKSLFWALAWACAHAPEEGFFADWNDEPKTRSTIEVWGRQLACTPKQLSSALEFVIRGHDAPPEGTDVPQDDQQAIMACPHTDLVDDALAAGLGLTPERIAAMPRRRVVGILRKWAENQIAAGGGKADIDKGAKTDAYVRYDDYLIEIRNAAFNKGLQIYA